MTAPTPAPEQGYEPSDAFGMLRSFTRHVAFVRLALASVVDEIERRALRHDLSKLLDDEFAGFARINAAARINKFGSPEYSDAMRRERATIDLHFSRNNHHGEFPTYPGNGPLTFLDIIEMVCDWRGAQQGYDDPRPWSESVELNIKSKGKYLSTEQLWLARQVAQFIEDHQHA